MIINLKIGNKHFPKILELLDNKTKERYNNNIQSYLDDTENGAWNDLRIFLLKNQYNTLPKPKDINVGFYTKLV